MGVAHVDADKLVLDARVLRVWVSAPRPERWRWAGWPGRTSRRVPVSAEDTGWIYGAVAVQYYPHCSTTQGAAMAGSHARSGIVERK